MTKREKPIEIITPPNMLRVKVGGRIAPADPEAIARAEKALQQMEVEFEDWINEEVVKLEKAMAVAKKTGLGTPEGEAVFIIAHDLRGLGTTYKFPIVTRIATSLARLIEDDERRATAPVALVGAHVNSIRAALAQNVRDDKHPIGKALAEELETQVIALVGEAQ